MATLRRLLVVGVMALTVPCTAQALFTFSGVQQNVPISSLTGWTQCFQDTYADSGTPIATILAQCSGAQLLMACRVSGSQTLTLAAMAPRGDVTFDTGTGANSTHTANGVNWYFNANWSWGFAPAGDSVDRDECDVAGPPDSNLRMCWHTLGGNGSISDGYRCGDNNLNGVADWDRLIFQAGAQTVAAPAPVLSWSGMALLTLALPALGWWALRRRASI